MSRHDGFVTVEFYVDRGLKQGEIFHRHVVLRESSVGDELDAEEAAGGVKSRAEIALVGSQIVRIGDIDGPLSLAQMRLLTSADCVEIMRQAAVLQETQVKKVKEVASSKGATKSGGPR